MPLSFLRIPLRRLPALGAVLASVAGAPAAVIHMDFSGVPVVIPNSFDGLYLNVVSGILSTAATPPAGWDINPYNNGTGLGFFAPATPAGQGTLASGPTALALLGGETIGPASLYQPDQALGTNFQITATQYAGFRFLNESTGQTNYGWLQLRTTGGGASPGFPASLLAYAYENTGAPLTAGQIPEPSSAGLLASGLFALLAGPRCRNRSSRAPAAA